ncbi:MAG: dimethylsulfonioproprionate lyase family protein [Pseudomonadota bacterium]
MFFIDANIDYPLHDHRSNELYVVLSGDVDIALGFGTDTVSHAPGSYAVVPPGTPHQLRTGSKPVLLAFIWTGEIKCPVHWWHEAEPGVWQRTLPPRAMYDASTEEMVGAQDILPTGLDHPNLGNAPPYPTRRPS